MPNNYSYVDFISDEDLFECIQFVYEKYQKEIKKITYEDFVKNKLDPFKMFFDFRMRGLSEEEWVLGEITRQLDRSIANEIGKFHEKIISKIGGLILDKKNESGVDLYNLERTVFVEVKNKHNTVKGEDKKHVFKKLESLANRFENANCYYVTISNTSSLNRPWTFSGKVNGEDVIFSHPRVYEVTADEFYHLLTGNPYAFKELCEKLPEAIDDFLKKQNPVILNQERALTEKKYSLASELINDSQKRGWNLETFLCSESFKKSKYKGFILKE